MTFDAERFSAERFSTERFSDVRFGDGEESGSGPFSDLLQRAGPGTVPITDAADPPSSFVDPVGSGYQAGPNGHVEIDSALDAAIFSGSLAAGGPLDDTLSINGFADEIELFTKFTVVSDAVADQNMNMGVFDIPGTKGYRIDIAAGGGLVGLSIQQFATGFIQSTLHSIVVSEGTHEVILSYKAGVLVFQLDQMEPLELTTTESNFNFDSFTIEGEDDNAGGCRFEQYDGRQVITISAPATVSAENPTWANVVESPAGTARNGCYSGGFGGTMWDNVIYTQCGRSNATVRTQLFEGFDSVSKAWASLDTVGNASYKGINVPSFRMEFLGKKYIFRIGGDDASANGQNGLVSRYDIALDFNDPLGSRITSRENHCICTDPVHGDVYVFGGFNAGGSLATVARYDCVADLVEGSTPDNRYAGGAIPNTPTAMDLGAAALWDGVLHVMDFQSGDLYTYDLVAAPAAWTTEAPTPPADHRACQNFQDGQYLYLMGGFNVSAKTTVTRYDCVSKTFTTLNSLPQGTSDGSAGRGANGKFYVAMGFAGSRTQDVIEGTP